jgi:glycerol-3-phosphate acyltransferase PlsY
MIGRLVKNIDIRSHGTNNAGASNVTIVLGWKFGALTALIDILKAALAVVVVQAIFPNSKELVFVAGAFAVIGHIYPFFLKFKGGKGAASLIGMTIAIDIKIALIVILAIIILTLVTDYIAVGSMGMFVAMPVTTYIFNYPELCTIIGIALMLICIYKHLANIQRIIKSEEKGLRKVIKKQ